MVTLKKLANAVWSNRKTIEFGGSSEWNKNTFLQSWVDEKNPGLWANRKGWYWIQSNITLDELIGISLPLNLPNKAAKFNEVARFNKERLAPSDIYKPFEEQFNVVYSGQECRVFTRLRLHFSLTMGNTGTGALGISSYPLSNNKWRESFFHEGMIEQLKNLSPEELHFLRVLISDSKSRDLVELCWRFEYGWPALCIK